jgi:hypothetical protein
MVQVADMTTIHARLKVWKFEEEWEEERAIIETFHVRIKKAYHEIETNKYFL